MIIKRCFSTKNVGLPRAIVSKDVESLQVGEDTASVDIASSNGHPHTVRVGVNRCNQFRSYICVYVRNISNKESDDKSNNNILSRARA